MSARVFTQAPPGGDWNSRDRSFFRILKILYKKQFITKFRHKSALIEIFIALFICILAYPIWSLSRSSVAAVVTPKISLESSEIGQNLGSFCGYGNKEGTSPLFYASPDTPRMRKLLEESNFLATFNGVFAALNIKEQASMVYLESVSEMKNALNAIENNGIGIYWKNVNDENASTNPIFQIYSHAFASITADVIKFLQVGLMKERMTEIQAIASPTPEEQLQQMRISEAVTAAIGFQQFSAPELTETFDISIFISLMVIIPIILATMPDMQLILDEKDSKVAALSFFMGCPETAYWIVNFTTPYILSWFPYLLMSIMFCFCFAMTNTSFILMLIISTLFIIAHIFFQFWLLTFMKTAKSGRMLTVTFLVLTMFFGFLHSFFTLSDSNDAPAVRHVFSIIPLSAFQMWMMNGYSSESLALEPYTFSNFFGGGKYPSWTCVLWLLIDIVLYAFLFIIFNLTMPRQFGASPIKWSELLSKEAWKRVLSKDKNDEESNETTEFFSISNLEKQYNDGGKPITALKDVDFHVNKNEVIVMIGPNGAGKSTLLNCIAGAIEPNNGTVSLFGKNSASRLIELQKYLGVVFQDNVIIKSLSIKEHLYMFGAFRGISEHEIEEAIDYYGDQLQLTHMLDNRAGDLSGGQKRKLCIAISLLGNPPLVLMDEPTAGVDVQARQLIWKMISSLSHTTSIITSHALEEAESVSSRLFILAAGSLVFSGTSTELRTKYKCGYLLRLDLEENARMGDILSKVRDYIPDAYINEEISNTIAFPVTDDIPELIQYLTENQKSLGINSFSCAVEQLEDMLLKLIQSEEAKCG